MHVQLICKQCNHNWSVQDEPETLAKLACPACTSSVASQVSEDFASALEDALAQLWSLGQKFAVQVKLDSNAVPAAFTPPDA